VGIAETRINLWQDTRYQGYKPDALIINQAIKNQKVENLLNNKKTIIGTQVRVRVQHPIW